MQNLMGKSLGTQKAAMTCEKAIGTGKGMH